MPLLDLPRPALFAAAFIGLSTLSCPQASAHGGIYRGPGDTVPPGAGSPPSSSPPVTGGRPDGPAPEAPAGPTTPPGAGVPFLPGSPGGGKGPSTPDGYVDTNADPTAWSFWWEFNKDPFLELKAAVHRVNSTGDGGDHFLGDPAGASVSATLAPTTGQIRDEIVPALLAALEGESDDDIVTATLIALAKIGDAPRGVGSTVFGPIFARFLDSPSQEVRETAALALGILGSAERANVDHLVALMNDSAVGRRLTGNPEQGVPLRTRTFAAYGLGLIGRRAANASLDVARDAIVKALAEALIPAEREATQDLAAAIVISMGLVPLTSCGDVDILERKVDLAGLGAIETLEEQIALLSAVLEDEGADRYMRAHVPTALGRLVRSCDGVFQQTLEAHVAALLLKPLDPKAGRGIPEEIQQSCALALGLIGDADGDPLDLEIRSSLMDAHRNHQRQTKDFALIALAKIAAREGEVTMESGLTSDPAQRTVARGEVAEFLTERLIKGRSGEQHYAGLALGVLHERLRAQGARPIVASLVALHEELASADGADDIGAFSVATGLAGSIDSKQELERKLTTIRAPSARGYVALSLGMLGSTTSSALIHALIEDSEYEPELLKQAAIALGLMGDKRTVEVLSKMLGEASSLSTQAALATALGIIGDRRSVEPLVKMLQDETLTGTARAFAAAALGLVADKEPMPWNSKIGVDLNYRASVETLNATDGKGVLNIL
jgi:HEAT repeat protein